MGMILLSILTRWSFAPGKSLPASALLLFKVAFMQRSPHPSRPFPCADVSFTNFDRFKFSQTKFSQT